jgi:hypothetical protein
MSKGNTFFEWYKGLNPGAGERFEAAAKKEAEKEIDRIIENPNNFNATGDYKGRWQDRFAVAPINEERVIERRGEIRDFKDLKLIKQDKDLVAKASRFDITPKAGDTVESLKQQIETKEKIAQATGLIRRSGPAAEGIKAPKTLEEANVLIEELKPIAASNLGDKTGAGQRAIAAHQSVLDTDESSRKSSAASIRASDEQIAASQAATKLAALQTRNKQALAEYELKANRYENDMRRNENNLDRAARAEEGAMRMELEYARLAQDDREDKQARKDKMMMMMLQGLGNMGAGFTI